MCFRKILFFKFSENMAEREPNQNQGSTSLVTVISPLARLFSLTSQFYLVYIEYRVYLGSISICPAHKFPTYLSIQFYPFLYSTFLSVLCHQNSSARCYIFAVYLSIRLSICLFIDHLSIIIYLSFDRNTELQFFITYLF